MHRAAVVSDARGAVLVPGGGSSLDTHCLVVISQISKFEF